MRVRVLALVAAAVLSLLGAVPAWADDGGGGGSDNNNQEGTYLALGDSVAFGTDPNRDPRVASNMVGYPGYVASALYLTGNHPHSRGQATGDRPPRTDAGNDSRH